MRIVVLESSIYEHDYQGYPNDLMYCFFVRMFALFATWFVRLAVAVLALD